MQRDNDRFALVDADAYLLVTFVARIVGQRSKGEAGVASLQYAEGVVEGRLLGQQDTLVAMARQGKERGGLFARCAVPFVCILGDDVVAHGTQRAQVGLAVKGFLLVLTYLLVAQTARQLWHL